MNLEEFSRQLAYEVAFWCQGLDNTECPLEELGSLSLEVSKKLRALAVIALAVGGNTDLFYHNLIRSGRARILYLKRVESSKEKTSHHWCCARYDPLVDAIVGGDLALASEIISLLPIEFRKGHEYEDDYCYGRFIACCILEPVREAELQFLLRRLTAHVDGKPNARLTVCSALTARDQAAFQSAFEGLLVERDLEIEAAKARGQLEEPHVIAQRRVFVEGLAILAIAERRGIRTENEYRYCPSIARVPMISPFPDE